jgi:hypothetical protein
MCEHNKNVGYQIINYNINGSFHSIKNKLELNNSKFLMIALIPAIIRADMVK